MDFGVTKRPRTARVGCPIKPAFSGPQLASYDRPTAVINITFGFYLVLGRNLGRPTQIRNSFSNRKRILLFISICDR